MTLKAARVGLSDRSSDQKSTSGNSSSNLPFRCHEPRGSRELTFNRVNAAQIVYDGECEGELPQVQPFYRQVINIYTLCFEKPRLRPTFQEQSQVKFTLILCKFAKVALQRACSATSDQNTRLLRSSSAPTIDVPAIRTTMALRFAYPIS